MANFVITETETNVSVTGGEASVIVVDASAGIQGPPGSQILSGDGTPSLEIGRIGDYYLNKINNDLYGPKTQDEGWGTPLSLGIPSNLILDGASDQQVLAYQASTDTWLPSTIRYTHTQASAASTWVVTHNLGMKPGGIAVVDSADTAVVGDVTYDNLNQVTIRFTAAFAGKAYIG